MIVLASACQMFSALTLGFSEHAAKQHFREGLLFKQLFFTFLLGLISFSQWHLVCVDNCFLEGISAGDNVALRREKGNVQ